MRNDRFSWAVHTLPMKKRRSPIWYAREWLDEKGLKQSHIVQRTGLSKGMVSEYISGSRRWNEDVLIAFAHALGIEPGDLLKPPNPPPNELAAYVMRLDEKRRAMALKILKAALEG